MGCQVVGIFITKTESQKVILQYHYPSLSHMIKYPNQFFSFFFFFFSLAFYEQWLRIRHPSIRSRSRVIRLSYCIVCSNKCLSSLDLGGPNTVRTSETQNKLSHETILLQCNRAILLHEIDMIPCQFFTQKIGSESYLYTKSWCQQPNC
jgi:hypothetical protein